MIKNEDDPSRAGFIALGVCCVVSAAIGLGIGRLIANNECSHEHTLPKFTEAKVSKIIGPSDRPVHQIECIVRCDANECKLAYRTTKGVL